MKKYGKVLLTAATAMLLSATTVNAKMMTAKELGALAEQDAPNARFIYVIGKYAYTSSYDNFDIRDVMLAAADSIEIGNKENIQALVDTMTIYAIDRTYDANYDATGWTLGQNEVGNGTAFGNGDEKVDIKYIDYKYLGALEIEENIIKAVEILNQTSEEEDGFSSITYDNHTVTFNISDPSKMLVDYKDNIMELIKSFISENGAVSVVYNGETTQLNGETDETIITKLAAKVLKDMAKAEEGTAANTLNYASVANKSAEATVNYVDETGNKLSVTYKLEFKYNFEEEKNKVLNSAADALNKEVVEKSEYGFKGITFEDNTLTFDIFEPSANLVQFSKSGIVNLFKNGYAGATKVVYKMQDADSKEIDLTQETLDETAIKKHAAEVLLYMAKNGQSVTENESVAKDLTLETVAGKTVDAVVTWADGTTSTYHLTFTFHAEAVKNEVLSDYATELNNADSNSGIHKMGFASVEYNSTTKDVVFEIGQPDGKFANATESIAEIAEMFEKWSTGATQVEYTVNGETNCDNNGPCKVTFNDGSSATTLAVTLLFKMAGLEQSKTINPYELTVGALAGTYAEAKFTFINGETVTYTVHFNFHAKERLDEKLEIYAEGLPALPANNGVFTEIDFDAKSGKATFHVGENKETTKFTEYGAINELLEMFNQAVAGATEVSFTVNGTTKKFPEEEQQSFNGWEIAKELLTAMAKANKNGQDQDSEIKPNELKLEDVLNVEASATIKYKVGKETEQDAEEITLKLEFVQDQVSEAV